MKKRRGPVRPSPPLKRTGLQAGRDKLKQNYTLLSTRFTDKIPRGIVQQQAEKVNAFLDKIRVFNDDRQKEKDSDQL